MSVPTNAGASDSMSDASPTIQHEAAARLEVARQAAAEVAEMALAVYQTPRLVVERKPDGSEVTTIDRDGEHRIRARINAAFADDAILGEEHGEAAGTSGWRWVLDPIDGTRSFTQGIPSFCTLIGIEFEGRPVAGFANYPALGESVEGVRGRGATWRTRSGDAVPARVSGEAVVADATIQLGAPSSFGRVGREAFHPRFASTVRRIRGWDDGFAFALVATGRVDGAVQCGLSRWDLSAFVPIIEEAGGTMVAWDGGDPLVPPGCVLAGSTELVHGLAGVAGGAGAMHHAD